MQEKIRNVLTMQKDPEISPHVPTVRLPASAIGSVLTADFTPGASSSMQRQSREEERSPPRIGIDLMGSDSDPSHLLEEAQDLIRSLNMPTTFFLFGTDQTFAEKSPPPSVHYISAKEVITMDDEPLQAVRRKKEASLCVGIRALKEGTIDAFISFGNTGALMASAKMTLQMLPGIERPALLALLPSKLSEIAVLDVGANASNRADHLVQFAHMGIAYQRCRGIKEPKVGLLNMGSESKKGTPLLREAYQQLQLLNARSSVPLFVGNIEGRDALLAEIDVLVTEGFTGNVFLKTAEGIAQMIRQELQDIRAQGELQSALNTLKEHLHYSRYPGALLSGVQGIVMKSHGEFSTLSLASTVKAAHELIMQRFLQRIRQTLFS